MDSSELSTRIAKASAAVDRAAESIKQFGAAIGPVAKRLQEKMRPFASAHLELERRRRASADPQD